jgi:peptide/nickel transport system permease protein
LQGYIARRLLATIPVIFVVAIFTFLLLRLTPGDPATMIAGIEADEEQIAGIRRALGLDRPMHIQLAYFFRDLFRGDLGESVVSGYPVTKLIQERFIPTFSLALLTELFAVFVGVPMGVLAAWKANTWIDKSVMFLCTLGFSVPIFFLGFLFIILFGVRLEWFPVAGYVPPMEGFGAFLYRLIMPALVTGIVLLAFIARMTRANMREILQEDYIRTARAKGLSEKTVLIRHAFKNAALPIVTVIGLGAAGLITGIVITESVFAIPGLGRLVVNAMLSRDYTIIQGAILTISLFYVLVNLVVDLTYAYFDPRIRY